jgi:hypothetical protein
LRTQSFRKRYRAQWSSWLLSLPRFIQLGKDRIQPPRMSSLQFPLSPTLRTSSSIRNSALKRSLSTTNHIDQLFYCTHRRSCHGLPVQTICFTPPLYYLIIYTIN